MKPAARGRARSGYYTLLFCMLVSFFSVASLASAERITYPGSGLRSDPVTKKQSVYASGASGNTVTLKRGSIPGVVSGSGAIMRPVSSAKNKVIIKGGTVKSGVYGAVSQKLAKKNTVSVTGKAKISQGAYGALSINGSVLSNKLTIRKGTVKGVAVGGASERYSAKKNTVIVSGGTVKGLVAGGYTAASANSNSVTIKKGKVTEGVAGGSGDSAANKNKVTITGGRVSGSIAGGASNKYAFKNQLVIRGVSLTASVAGGAVWQASSMYGAVGNKVTIERATINAIPKKKVSKKSPRLVAGGAALGGSPVTGNLLTLVSANIGPAVPVAGGYALATYSSTSVSNNQVNATGSTIRANVYGGYSKKGYTFQNSVRISDGSVTGNIFGGWSDSYASYNRATITSGSHAGHVYGGMSNTSFSSDNTVFLSGGSIGKNIYGGYSTSSNAGNNQVLISGGVVMGQVYGGVGTTSVRNNTVDISGGTFAGDIIGGQANLKPDAYYSNPYTLASGNTVILSGAPNLAGADIYGARFYRNGSFLPNKNSGNTLVVNGFCGAVKGLYNFANYKFTLPQNVENNATVVRSSAKVSLEDASVSVLGFAAGAKPLGVGNVVTLIKNTGGKPVKFNGTGAKRGVTEIYNFSLVDDSANLVVKVDSVDVNAKISVFTKARTETLDLLTRSADRVAEQTMSAVRLSAKLSATSGGGLFLFGDRSGSLPGLAWSSEGKVSSSLAGLGFSSATAYGTLAFGSFFESGWTDRHTDAGTGFDSAALREREQSSYGSGVLARFDHTSGLYAEGAFRYGKAQNNFSESGLRDGFGNRAAFDAGFAYTGFHTGLGHVYALNDSVSVESYSKLFVTRLDGGSADVLGDKLHFSGSESRRIRSGAKFSFAFDERINAFAGLAHEYEADGKIRADIADHKLERDGARGHSAMFQAGFSFKPVADAPVSLYVDYRGYAGARKDTNATAGLMFEF